MRRLFLTFAAMIGLAAPAFAAPVIPNPPAEIQGLNKFQGFWLVDRSTDNTSEKPSVLIVQCPASRNDQIDRTYYTFKEDTAQARQVIEALADVFECSSQDFKTLSLMMDEIAAAPLYMQQRRASLEVDLIPGEVGNWFLMDPGPREVWQQMLRLDHSTRGNSQFHYRNWIDTYNETAKTLGWYEVYPGEQVWSLTADGDLLVRIVWRESAIPDLKTGRPMASLPFRPHAIKRL